MTSISKTRPTPRLRPGPGGLPRGQVTEIQRSRMLAAAVEAVGAGHRILEHRARALAEVAKVIDRGREARAASGEPPEVTAECVVGAIFAVLHARLLEGDGEPLTSLLGPLMSMILLPYL